MRRLFFVLVILLVPAMLFAQTDRATITGTVTDTSGAIVPGVEVVATHVATKVQSTSVTNDSGIYTILNLPIGVYTVTFKKDGFKTVDREGFALQIAQVAKVDAVMAVGAVTEVVNVNEAPPILETESTQVGAGMNYKIMDDLPLDIRGGRSLENFAYATVAGVEGNNWTSYIGGSQAFSKEVLIDGTSAVVQIGGHIGESSPSMEAIEEFKVETSGVRAEDGRTGGGVYKFTLKSGTNQIHGSAFWYLHNEVLNANTWQNNFEAAANPSRASDYKRDRDRQNVYGFSGGGPVRKDKTFWFGAFEKYTQERFVLGGFDKTVPIPAFLDGNFGALLDTGNVVGQDALGRPIYSGQIYDPLSQRSVTKGAVDPVTGLIATADGTVKDPFTNNIIPSDRISSIGRKVADLYRAGYQPMRGGLINNSAITRQNDPWFHQTQLTFKGDHNFSDRNRLSSHFVWTERPRILADSGGLWQPSQSLNAGGPLSSSRFQNVTSRRFAISDNHTISPAMINTASFTFGRYRNPSEARTDGHNWPQELGLGDVGVPNFPGIDYGRAINGIAETNIDQHWRGFYVGNSFIWNDTLRWVKGKHTLSFGGEFRALQISSHDGDPYVSFDFTPDQTGLPSAKNTTGFGFASMLLGEVNAADKSTPFDLYGRRKTLSLFAQDDWKVSPRLTVSLDLRWEMTFPLHEKYGRWSNFDKEMISPDYGIPGTLVFAKGGSDTFEKKKDWKEFGPHVGVAYQLSPKVVLRGAYGIFFVPIGTNYWFGVPYGYAQGFKATDKMNQRADRKPLFNWDNGYPGNYVAGTQNPTDFGWGPVSVDPKSLFAGYTHNWNFGVQYELSRDTRIEAMYVGNIGRRLQSGDFSRNEPDMAAYTNWYKYAGPNWAQWNSVWDAASAAAEHVPYPYPGFGSYAFAALLPYPQVWQGWGWPGPIFGVATPKGSSDYNAMQLTMTKRGSSGVSGLVSYTLGAAHGNAQGYYGAFQETWGGGPLQCTTDACLQSESHAPLSYDLRHVMKGILAWDLPLGKGRRLASNFGRVGNAIVSGWTLSGSFRYNTGYPLYVGSTNYYEGWTDSYLPIYAAYNPTGDYGSKFNGSKFDYASASQGASSGGNVYFDKSNISNPAQGEFASHNIYRSDFRGPGYSQEDISLLKNFQIGERMKLQFRAEFYNIFNRHYFANPDTNIDSATFGQVINLSGTPREGQFGMRFTF